MKISALTAIVFTALTTSVFAQPTSTPNVVLFFIDDQGYADVGVYGAQGYETPSIDKMAADGVRFTDWYVTQGTCTASRAGLITGCYSNRVGLTGAMGPTTNKGLNSSETTIAEIFKSKDYATLMVGKWHLGVHKPFLPIHHGFDEFFGIPYSHDMWPLHPEYFNLSTSLADRKRGHPDLPIIEGDEVAITPVTGEIATQFTTMFTERAVSFINRNKEDPFFLYIAHPMPHVPLFISDKFNGTTQQGAYGDTIAEIDWSVGQVIEALERNGLTDDTLVIFTSDNGPWLTYGNHAGRVGPLREGKGTTFDGGVRTPCIMKWPGVIDPGTVQSEPAMTIDLLPTFANLIGADQPTLKIDGMDIWPLITTEPGAKSPQEAYFFYYNANDLQAVRMGKWKLHFPHGYRSMIGVTPGKDGTPANYSSRSIGLSLFDLENDIGESTNVAAQYPQIVDQITALADVMRADLGDNLTGNSGNGRRSAATIKK